MSLQLVANHLAQKGRGPDSTLVHMSNREVAGLNALAKKHGGQLSVNPDTGLPEAGFLDNILPMVAGAGLTYFSGGAINPLMAGGIIGGITALDSKDLSKGLVAGLGAYGGSGMVGGLAGLGAEGAYGAGAAGEAARAAGTEAAIANGTYQSQVGTGLGNFIDQPMTSLSALGGGSALKGSLPILAGLAPAAVEAFDEEDEDKPPEQHKGYIRKYAFDPVTGQYKQVGAYEAGGDPNVDVTAKAGTAGAYGGVGQSEYEAAQGMAEGGATDSSRIYDYLMGRGPNPMQFTHTQRPQVDYNVNKPDAPITPTTQILEPVYDLYGNRTGGGGMDADQLAEREKAYNTPQDYLSIDRYDPEATASLNRTENAEPGDRYAPARVTTKDVQSQASLAAMSPAERAMHMQDVRLQSPIRTAALDFVENVGIIPIGVKFLESIMHPFGKPVNLNPAPVENRTTYNMDVANDLQRQQEATQRLQQQADDGTGNSLMGKGIGEPGGPGSNEGGGYGGAAGRDSDGPGQSGSGGWGRGATGGLSTPYGFQRMAHGGIANLYNLGSYSDGGRLLKGPGDGVSDDIPATIGNGQPARLADGEFVIPARIVSELGNGSTDAGARALYKMMDRIQAGRRKTVGKDQVAKNSKSARHLPA
jgi:hypothetical protein